MGATFPIAADWSSRDGAEPNAAGLLYAVNTAGAALGAIAAGFPHSGLGLRGTTDASS